MNSGKIAGINPYNGKSVHYSFFTYRQPGISVFRNPHVDVVEISAYASSGALPGRRCQREGFCPCLAGQLKQLSGD